VSIAEEMIGRFREMLRVSLAGAQQDVVEGEGLDEQGTDDLWHGQLRKRRKAAGIGPAAAELASADSTGGRRGKPENFNAALPCG